MIARCVRPSDVTLENISGAILCNDVVVAGESGRVKLAKGTRLRSSDAEALRASPHELHLVDMSAGDIHEDEAAVRLARAIAGPGISVRDPVESQVHMRAAHRGVFHVNVHVLQAINDIGDPSVFTVFEGQPVEVGKAVATAKVTPLVVPESQVQRVESLAATTFPMLYVKPFTACSVGVIVRDRFSDTTREQFEGALDMKLGWFGSHVDPLRYVGDDPAEIASMLAEFVHGGVGLVLAGGVNSTDPLDPIVQALGRIGAVTERRGVPAHPGSTCWLSYCGDIPIFGLALCGMFAKTTVFDLLLPRFLSRERVASSDLAALGHGGLLSRDMQFRFPDYSADGPAIE